MVTRQVLGSILSHASPCRRPLFIRDLILHGRQDIVRKSPSALVSEQASWSQVVTLGLASEDARSPVVGEATKPRRRAFATLWFKTLASFPASVRVSNLRYVERLRTARRNCPLLYFNQA